MARPPSASPTPPSSSAGERLGLERPALVGHSLGALVCLGRAALAQEAGRLVLIAPPVRTIGSDVLAHALPALRTILRLPPSAAVLVASDIAARSPLALLRAAGELMVADHADAIAAVRAPTLLLWGERDELVPPEGVAELERLIPDARALVLPARGTCRCSTAPTRSTGRSARSSRATERVGQRGRR